MTASNNPFQRHNPSSSEIPDPPKPAQANLAESSDEIAKHAVPAEVIENPPPVSEAAETITKPMPAEQPAETIAKPMPAEQPAETSAKPMPAEQPPPRLDQPAEMESASPLEAKSPADFLVVESSKEAFPPTPGQSSTGPSNNQPTTETKKLPLILSGLALFLGVIALLAALGFLPISTVGEDQIKNNAVTGTKIKPKSLYPNSFSGNLPPGPPGPKGDKGDPGLRGLRGLAGPRGPAGVVGIGRASEQTAVSSAPRQSAEVSCPAGKRALGGGATINGGGGKVAITSSTVNGSGNGWAAAASEVATFSGQWSLEVTVICATNNKTN